ncbi:hypothetical protein [Enterococcus sp. BWR-S5]|uniref:hypothetical protein n=1 Tax=Enterococcus sp. BWR-S5 TaxID=2787714 RepID=UPI001924B6C3|nr:hypothetical protein [Enterococcus sp. BWR-S5]MBL1227267.1 hypothetical protein [Enterococcus sp. BWR-S5]
MKSKLQTKREQANLSILELAEKSAVGIMAGCSGHMKLTIEFIETGIAACPKPRRTYEYAALAHALKCTVNDLID